MSDVMDKARGRWAGILRTLGVEEQFLKNQHGPCPMCGGKDRYRWDDKNGDGTYYCNSCGAGDGWLLAQKLTGESASAVAKKIFNMVGGITKADPKPVDNLERNRQRLNRIMQGCDVEAEISAVRLYLRNRGLPMANGIFFHPALPYYQDGAELAKFPAMITKFYQGDKAVTIHATYLTPDGKKANVLAPKKIFPKCGELAGSAIRLTQVYPEMGIAEGIETALAVMKIFNMPCWASGTAGLLEKFNPPKEIKHLHIYADNDSSFTGQSAAYNLAKRLAKQKLFCQVHVPEDRGFDFADYIEDRNGRANVEGEQ